MSLGGRRDWSGRAQLGLTYFKAIVSPGIHQVTRTSLVRAKYSLRSNSCWAKLVALGLMQRGACSGTERSVGAGQITTGRARSRQVIVVTAVMVVTAVTAD